MSHAKWHRVLLLGWLPAVFSLMGCQKELAKGEQVPSAPAPGAPTVQTAQPARQEVAPAKAEPAESEAVAAARRLGTPAKGAVVTTASGLQYIDVTPGEGAEAKAGEKVTVHYTGWLVTGAKFDSSLDRGEPFAFPLGAGRVIKGWDEGVAGMRPGGVRKLIIPPSLGYGSRAIGPIPADSTLIFEVKLLTAQ